MATRNIFSALSILALLFSIVACTKPALEEIPTPIEKVEPTLPDGNRIIIHFGTSTYRGCMYSFSNCIWIGWGDALDMHRESFTLQLNNSTETDAAYGNFFPLTDNVTLDDVTGVPPQTLKSGFYRFQLSPDGRKIISFSPENCQPVAPLVNPNNPQDNIGQLHNLAMQSIYNAQTKEEAKAANYDIKALKKIVAAKTSAFLGAEADLNISEQEQSQIEASTFSDNYSDHHAWLATSRLSANDRQTLGDLIDMADAMPVNSPEELSKFVLAMTDAENLLAKSSALENPKLVLSAISVMKYSRYYWFWKTRTHDNPAARADWWKADLKGLIEGGIGQAIVDSIIAALK